MRYLRMLSAVLVLASCVIAIGCGGPPANNPLLQEAETSYEEASNDPQVVSNAPVALDEAEEALVIARRLWRQKAEKARIDHHAYLAQQRVRIAQQMAALNAAEAEIQRAEVERKEVQLRARAAEAERAEQRAEENLQRADEARREAQDAFARAEELARHAEELARRVEELEATRSERGLVLTLGDVLFDVGRAELKPGAMATIEKVASFLKEYPERTVLIEGHTDNTGSAQTNELLSRQRAESVQAALTARGVPTHRVRTRGSGPQYPVASNATAAGRQQNRRVEIVISDDAGVIPERE